MTGPSGYGSKNFVRADSLLPYTIHFENETNATAPAQQVVLSDRLTNLLDWTTFELTEIAFGDQFIAIPPHTQHFETSKQLSVNGYQFVVQIEAGIHLDTGEVYARFQSLNPTNGLPPPVEIGFLPPENGTGRGQGHLSYVIRAEHEPRHHRHRNPQRGLDHLRPAARHRHGLGGSAQSRRGH